MKKNALLYIVIAGVLWGTSGIFVHFMSPMGFSTMHMIAARSGVATLSILIYTLFYNRKLLKVKPKELLVFAASGISFLGTGSFYYAAIQASSVSTAVILMYTAPIMVMIFSVAFLGERFTPKKFVSLTCMMIGCALVSGVVGGLTFSPLGIVLGLLSGICYAAYNVITKVGMNYSYHPVTATFYCFLTAFVFALMIAQPLQMGAIIAQNPLEAPLLMLGLGVVTCILPYFLYTLALREIPAGTASALGIIEPMSATLFSVTLLGEALSVPAICGIVLILGAVFMLSRSNG